MKVAIVFLTKDADVTELIRSKKGSIVPRELCKDGVQYNTILVDSDCSDDELFTALVNAHKKHEAVGIFAETGSEGRLRECTTAIFMRSFDPIEAKGSMKNYFGHHLARWLKNLMFMSRSFKDAKHLKCLMLPFLNFNAPESDDIISLINTKNDKGDFQESVETLLKIMRERSIPKKKKSGKQHFLKDDSARYFELGKEKHGQAEVELKPHLLLCNLTSWARFGVTLDRDLHYNISLEDKDISGEFNICHGGKESVKACTHINMFPNSFIR